jgi:hypothetical protein
VSEHRPSQGPGVSLTVSSLHGQVASGLSYALLANASTTLVLFLSRIPSLLQHGMQGARRFSFVLTERSSSFHAINSIIGFAGQKRDICGEELQTRRKGSAHWLSWLVLCMCLSGFKKVSFDSFPCSPPPRHFFNFLTQA